MCNAKKKKILKYSNNVSTSLKEEKKVLQRRTGSTHHSELYI